MVGFFVGLLGFGGFVFLNQARLLEILLGDPDITYLLLPTGYWHNLIKNA